VPLDDDGVRPDLLEARLIDLRREGVRPKFVYLVPDFQNPAGVTLSLERRREILAIAREFDLLVIEDSPYRELRYVGETIPCLGALDDDGRVLSLFTFSKILCPGLRLGWIVGSPEIIARLVIAKQPVDLCTSGLNQLIASKFLAAGLLPGHVAKIRASYARKREVMLGALERHVDPAWGVRWTRPEGGLFTWVTLPEWMNARELLDRALEREVAFVIGAAFHCDGSGQNTFRLNFSYPTHEQLEAGVRRLASAIGDMMQEAPGDARLSSLASPRPPLLTEDSATLEQLSWNLALSEVVG
jgi:2-aminoadipate transaminase